MEHNSRYPQSSDLLNSMEFINTIVQSAGVLREKFNPIILRWKENDKSNESTVVIWGTELV